MESGPDITPGSGVDAGIVPGTGSKIGPGGDKEFGTDMTVVVVPNTDSGLIPNGIEETVSTGP